MTQVLLTLRRLAWITREARIAITLDTLAHAATCTALQTRTAATVEQFVQQNSFADARLAELYPVSGCFLDAPSLPPPLQSSFTAMAVVGWVSWTVVCGRKKGG